MTTQKGATKKDAGETQYQARSSHTWGRSSSNKHGITRACKACGVELQQVSIGNKTSFYFHRDSNLLNAETWCKAGKN